MAAPFARPYVDALRDVAGSLDAFEALVEPLADLARAVSGSEELRTFFLDPSVAREAKAATLEDVAGKLGITGLALKAGLVLLSNRRIGRAGELVSAMRERVDRERRRVEASVVAARPLDEAAAAAIAAALQKQTG